MRHRDGISRYGRYRHVPTGTLARLAQRLGKVFASPSTWRRLVRIHRWRRPRQRVHPAQPKVGIRASKANEIWRVDTMLIRLLDGSRVYLRAVIDNFSRRILAWNVFSTFQPELTAKLLRDAVRNMNSSGVPTVMTDGGSENFNSAVDELVRTGVLKRLLAQTNIQFSNSMIEAWWHGLKHQWLYLNPLDTLATVKKLVAFYVEQHNTHLPHTAFQGQTPDEMYFGIGAGARELLKRYSGHRKPVIRVAQPTVSCPDLAIAWPSAPKVARTRAKSPKCRGCQHRTKH